MVDLHIIYMGVLIVEFVASCGGSGRSGDTGRSYWGDRIERSEFCRLLYIFF